MRRAITVLSALAVLALPAAAHAGGWASVSISPLPGGTQPGKPWKPKLTVLQHGQSPMQGITPAVIIKGPDGKQQRFDAKPTDEIGVYQANVVFPTKGTYTYTVDDGFTNAFPVDYPPVHVGAPAAAQVPPATPAEPATPVDDGGFPWSLYLVSVGILALLGGGLALGFRGSRRASAAV
jgi:hypothetical protein